MNDLWSHQEGRVRQGGRGDTASRDGSGWGGGGGGNANANQTHTIIPLPTGDTAWLHHDEHAQAVSRVDSFS